MKSGRLSTAKENWYAENCFFVLEHCKNYINELEIYSWQEDKDNTPEDKNDHMINSVQYAWLPYKKKIGLPEKRPLDP